MFSIQNCVPGTGIWKGFPFLDPFERPFYGDYVGCLRYRQAASNNKLPYDQQNAFWRNLLEQPCFHGTSCILSNQEPPLLTRIIAATWCTNWSASSIYYVSIHVCQGLPINLSLQLSLLTRARTWCMMMHVSQHAAGGHPCTQHSNASSLPCVFLNHWWWSPLPYQSCSGTDRNTGHIYCSHHMNPDSPMQLDQGCSLFLSSQRIAWCAARDAHRCKT